MQKMENTVNSTHESMYEQISARINETIKLLEALAAQPDFYDPNVPPVEKVKKLNSMSEHMNYLMMCYVDSDINVHSVDFEPVTLASRDYLQQLYSTGRIQVTDSFAAGADGVTLNYTIAVPLKKDNEITGSLFCAIYFSEIGEILEKSSKTNGINAVLSGSKGQVMSFTGDMEYGEDVLERIRNSVTFGITADTLETRLIQKTPGSFWSIKGGNFYYTQYCDIENTGWDLFCTIDFWSMYRSILPNVIFISCFLCLLCAGTIYMMKRYIRSQMKVVDLLVQSVQELEEKIYLEERPDNMNFKEIIQLTSDGLSDGLTGVVTRSVFLNQTRTQLKKISKDKRAALCFVDLDDLKRLNDTYGHGMGDVALKSIGYILREYEKKYDGVVGRYGGDEFVILLTDLDTEDELKSVLNEMSHRLHLNIGTEGDDLWIQCSVGVALWKEEYSLEKMIANADEALYFVKQNGKGYYKIHQD